MKLFIYIFSFLLVALLNTALAMSSAKSANIVVNPKYQACENDTDCVRMEVECNSHGCECGVAVNKEYKAKYDVDIAACRKDRLLATCDFDCAESYPKCIDNKCIMSSEQAVPMVNHGDSSFDKGHLDFHNREVKYGEFLDIDFSQIKKEQIFISANVFDTGKCQWRTQDEIMEILATYKTVEYNDWIHDYHHVNDCTQKGSLVLDNGNVYEWLIRSGGIAMVLYPDHSMVYLARDLVMHE